MYSLYHAVQFLYRAQLFGDVIKFAFLDDLMANYLIAFSALYQNNF